MQLKPEYQLPHAPSITADALGVEHVALLATVGSHLYNLHKSGERVVSAVALFDFCRASPQGTLPEWRHLAARSGAMSLRDYGEALSEIRKLLGRANSLELVDTEALKRAERTFRQHFPRAEKLRHSVAHPEHYANPNINMSSDTAINMQSLQASATTTIQGIIGDTYIATINGLTVKWEITAASAAAIIDVTRIVYEALSKLSLDYRLAMRRQRLED